MRHGASARVLDPTTRLMASHSVVVESCTSAESPAHSSIKLERRPALSFYFFLT